MPDPSLRLEDIAGQDSVVGRIRAYSGFFCEAGNAPEPILLTGEDGMGKSTIAAALASEFKTGFQAVESASLESTGDLTALLTNLKPRQVLLLSNVQSLRKMHFGILLGAIRDGKITITIGQGLSARQHVMLLNPFALVATCPKRSICPADLLSAFSLVLGLETYSRESLCAIAGQIGAKLGITFEPGAAESVVRCCDGRPGHLLTLIQRIVRSTNKTTIANGDLSRAFAALGINLRSDFQVASADAIQLLSGRDFEGLITAMLTRMGFRAEMTKPTGDGGIDIIATLDKPIFGGRYLFQCKRFAPDNLIGSPTVRDFYGAVTADRAVKGIFITTSDFTLQAREFAEKVGIELLNAGELHKLLAENGLVI